jgi:hypothetical protein
MSAGVTTELISFYPRDISSVLIKCPVAMEIGSSTPTFPLDAGQPFSLSHEDFSKEALEANNYIRLYGRTAADSTAHILVLRR